MNNSTYTTPKKEEPITLKSLEDIWENHEIIPVIFKPIGEIVYTTPFVAQKIQEHNSKK